MGLIIGQKNIELERRYSRLDLYKDMQSGSVTIRVTYEDGYYDTGRWRTVETNILEVRGDMVKVLMEVTAQTLGLSTLALGPMLDATIYALLSGQIATHAHLTIKVEDEAQQPLAATVMVRKGDSVLAVQSGSELALDLPVSLGISVEASAAGYKPASQTIPLLQGEQTLTLTLTPETAA